MDQANHSIDFRFEIPATFKYLNVVSNSLTAILEQVDDLPERANLTYNIVLAVHEVCTNIVEHAYAGNDGKIKIDVCLNEQSRSLRVDLYDTGQPFDLIEVTPPDLDEAPIRGYGLFLVQELMDEVTYKSGQENNHWCLTKHLL